MASHGRGGTHRFRSGPLANTTVTPFVAPIQAGEDAEWQGVEWFFQAWKTGDLEARRLIREAPTWRAAKQLGQHVRRRSGWDTGEPVEDQRRVHVMLAGMRFKFRQHEEARGALIATGFRTILEDLPDPFWGVGPDDKGQNWTGRLLRQVRDEIAPDELPF